jgi:signal peptidase II
MFQKTSSRIILILSLLLSNFGCDQITKNLARNRIGSDETIEVISTYFTLLKVENEGAFLSMGDQLSGLWGKLILVGIPFVVLSGILYYAFTDTKLNIWSIIGFAFVAGGGFANLYDRILYGSVTDFMFIDLGFARTGVFNMADVLGVSFWDNSQTKPKNQSNRQFLPLYPEKREICLFCWATVCHIISLKKS